MALPGHYLRFQEDYPELAEAYEKFGEAAHTAGPLSDKERALIKIGICAGAGSEGGLHSAVRKAVEAGLSKDEIRHAVLLAIPSIGFPCAMAALSWANDILG